jgi:hypothetical protein
MTADAQRTLALGRLARLRRLARAAHAMHAGLAEERTALRDAAARTASDLRGAALRRQFDRGAEFGPAGEAIGLRTKSRRLADGDFEHEVERVRVPELDALARVAARTSREHAELVSQMDGSGSRWQSLAPLVAAAEQHLSRLGWLEEGDPAAAEVLHP